MNDGTPEFVESLVAEDLKVTKAEKVRFYTLAVVTFGTAVPAGQFDPGIMTGSSYEILVKMFVVNFYEKLNIDEGM
ncbi:OLC1v1007061C1 [Oldenlandia corymbosa var. corymbosa]|uniref:OLC1v1007061C1 n=1 Tax=Oldenlandia corymbosa var. corymbosa TaxID=529605 RepID=A0AAV1DL75_OLDCO|nr:OLC1v1007061C1 [Oldenlandia corymbosa var. corymbosa]